MGWYLKKYVYFIGNDYYITLTGSIVDLKFEGCRKSKKSRPTKLFAMKHRVAVLIAFPLVFSFCTKPYEKIEHTTWEGQIHRMDDDKVLSDVRLKLSDDTLYLFSNAIFGADNDTLLLQNFTKTDSVFTYKSINGRTFNFKYRRELRKSSKT